MEKDKRIDWVNQHVSLKDLLLKSGQKVPVNRVIYCPFHDNSETPAAKLYEDSNTIYCFAETRHYTAYDYLKIILNKSNEEIFEDVPDEFKSQLAEKKDRLVPWVEYKYDKFHSTVKLLDYLMNLDMLWRERHKYKQIKT